MLISSVIVGQWFMFCCNKQREEIILAVEHFFCIVNVDAALSYDAASSYTRKRTACDPLACKNETVRPRCKDFLYICYGGGLIPSNDLMRVQV